MALSGLDVYVIRPAPLTYFTCKIKMDFGFAKSPLEFPHLYTENNY